MTLYEIIKAIQTTSGSKAKKAVLEANRMNLMLRQYLKAVYDPAINYYITKLPAPLPVSHGTRGFAVEDMANLMKLNTREVSGAAAKALLAETQSFLDAQGRELLGYIIGRDIKAGIAESTVLSVFPGLFFVPPYQRCASMDADLKERFGQMDQFYVQSKSDGQFCYAIHRVDNTVQAMTRAGSLYPFYVANWITVNVPRGYVAMGELLVKREGKLLDRKTGNGILNSVLSGDGTKFNPKTDAVKYHAWDMVTEAEFDQGFSDRFYEERFMQLCQTEVELIPSWTVDSLHEANKLQAEHVARGEEGTVWKNPKMKWRDCSSGDKDMMKAKVVFEADYEIIGYYEGEGKAAGSLGGLTLATSDRKIVFNCGSGFSDTLRKALWAVRETLPGKIVAAEGNDIVTSKGKDTESIFLPIFLELRADKKEADSHARVWEQFNAVKAGK